MDRIDTHQGKKEKPHVCFVALRSFNLLSQRKDICHVGGAEVQQQLIANWLVAQGYPVSFVTLDHGQKDASVYSGITIFKAYDPQKGVAGLRFIYPRWLGLHRALTRVNADIYYQRSACCETGQVALWCKLHKKSFIFALASEEDCSKRPLTLGNNKREWILYRLGIKLADVIVAQTLRQQAIFCENYGLSSILVRSCSQQVDDKLLQTLSAKRNPSVLWIGRFSPEKRLEWLLDVAEKCPEITFDVVGTANLQDVYASSLVQRTSAISNVVLHGEISHAQVEVFFAKCQLLCCTSEYEGFPNTFLEAWRVGVPVVSTFDPDDLIATQGLGRVVSNVTQLEEEIRSLLASKEQLERTSRAAFNYFINNHTIQKSLPQFSAIIDELAHQI